MMMRCSKNLLLSILVFALTVAAMPSPTMAETSLTVGKASNDSDSIIPVNVGDQLGYFIGLRTGPRIFTREDSLLFKRAHLMRAHAFYEKHGGKTIILARFVPVIRTFAPVVAGVAEMNYRNFVTYNVVGGVLWVWSTALLGYSLGRVVPDIDKHIHKVIVVVVFLSLLPAIIEFWRARREADR